MAGVDAFDEFPSLIPAQLGKEYAVGLHAQTGSQGLLRRNLGAALIFTRVEQMDFVRVLIQENLMHVLDGDQPFIVNTTVDYPQAKTVLGCGGLTHPPTPLIEGKDRACRVDKSAAFLLYKEEKQPQSRVFAE